MQTSDYTIRKFLINNLSTLVNLQYPSKATVDNKPMLYIGDSTVTRSRIQKANTFINGQLIPSGINYLCEFRVDFVAVGENYKLASDEISKVLDAIYASGFINELNKLLPMDVFNVVLEESLMTTQAEATNTMYVHTQTISFSYGE